MTTAADGLAREVKNLERQLARAERDLAQREKSITILKGQRDRWRGYAGTMLAALHDISGQASKTEPDYPEFADTEHAESWGVAQGHYESAVIARKALRSIRKPLKAKPRPVIAVVVEGGLVQDIISDQPKAVGRVFVIDYDTDGAANAELTDVPQSDGSKTPAHVGERVISKPEIDLRTTIRRAEAGEPSTQWPET